jgi:hypothetical protein
VEIIHRSTMYKDLTVEVAVALRASPEMNAAPPTLPVRLPGPLLRRPYRSSQLEGEDAVRIASNIFLD